MRGRIARAQTGRYRASARELTSPLLVGRELYVHGDFDWFLSLEIHLGAVLRSEFHLGLFLTVLCASNSTLFFAISISPYSGLVFLCETLGLIS